MEKRKEYDEGDIIFCPRCESDDLDTDEAPGHAKCNKCGLEMTAKTVVIWEE
jgi:transcription initiation factor TFIIIB Brf1 subunit/transcription initiation factor TFIIB